MENSEISKENEESDDEEIDYKELHLKLAENKEITQKITIILISKTSIDPEITNKLDDQAKMDYICNLRKIHLEWLGIEKIENLNFFDKLQILFLQYNKIKKIEKLETLINLEYLALNGNRIEIIENLKDLKNLLFFDISENQIKSLDVSEIPQNIEYLNISNNPLEIEIYEKSVILHCGNLIELDSQIITAEKRFKYMGIFPKHLENYSKELQKFHQKEELNSNSNDEQESFDHEFEPINDKLDVDIMNDELINETEEFKVEIRNRTVDIIEKAKERLKEKTEEFKKDVAEAEEMHKILIKTIKNGSKYFTSNGSPKKK